MLLGGENVREYLTELRKHKGMTQQDVATAVGVSRQYYNLIENGERQRRMDILLAAKIATTFEVSIMEIVDFERQYNLQAKEDKEREERRVAPT